MSNEEVLNLIANQEGWIQRQLDQNLKELTCYAEVFRKFSKQAEEFANNFKNGNPFSISFFEFAFIDMNNAVEQVKEVKHLQTRLRELNYIHSKIKNSNTTKEQ